MKYGETFPLRSIPEWQAYNVDYNDIKALIKDRTTRPGSSLIVVPGHHDRVAETDFEDELFVVLRDQHEGVNMFVRSKAGEIKRRLDHLLKFVVQLRRRIDGSFKKIPLKRMERFSKAENDTLKAGEELQSLARFMAAQEQAFRKLLKKYKKWTGSSRLETRFGKEVLEKSTVFTRRDIDPLLTQYENVLETLRVPFNGGLTWGIDGTDERIEPPFVPVDWASKVPDDSPAAENLHFLSEHGSNLELDAGFATVPLGHEAGYATYWVHAENLIQLHILMLQHTRLRASHSRSFSTPLMSPNSSRRGSISTAVEPRQSFNESDFDLVVVDDPEEFGKRRSGTTIEEIETQQGRKPEEATICVRFGTVGDAIVDIAAADETLRAYVTKKKFLRPLLSAIGPESQIETIPSTRDSSFSSQRPEDNQSLAKIQTFLVKNQQYRALARIRAKRTRFIGLDNHKNRGLWATLDKDVSLQPCAEVDLDNPLESDWNSESFPHAILTLRWEGQQAPGILGVLDKTHLTERVPGFSLETHAVATLCKPESMPAPFWLQALEKDIRKLPQSKGRSRKGTTTPESIGTSPNSNSAASQPDGNPSSGFSVVPSDTPATSVPEVLEAPLKPKRKRKPMKLTWDVPPERDVNAPRYWNEFDDGEEGSQEEYAIYVDPNATDPISQLWTTLSSNAEKLSEKVRAWMKPKADSQDAERARLLPRYNTDTSVDSSHSADSDSSPSPRGTSLSRPIRPAAGPFPNKYSTFPSFHHERDPLDPLATHHFEQRDILLTRCAAGAFAASYLLLIVAAILEATRRRRYEFSADIGTLVGIVASLVFGVSGVGLGFARDEGGGWVNKVQVGLAFMVLLVGNGIVILLLLGN